MALLTTKQVQDLFKVDRSTIYRMAEDGRLPAVKVGRQWRFRSDDLHELLGTSASGADDTFAPSARHAPVDDSPVDERFRSHHVDLQSVLPVDTAQAIADLAGDLFGVMAVVTDMAGRSLTTVANPCGFFTAVYDSVVAPDRCSRGWRKLGEQIDLEPQFVASHLGFLCARSFIRSGSSLAGMVIVGGVAPEQWPPSDAELASIADETGTPLATVREHAHEVYWIDRSHQDWIVRNLSQVSDLVSRLADEHGRLVQRLGAIADLARSSA